MKMFNILKIQNMQEILPDHPEHKIVLFNSNPKISCPGFNAATDAKLWFHFDPKQADQITAQQLIEVGALSSKGAESAVEKLRNDLQSESKGIRVKYISSVPFLNKRVIFFVHPSHLEEVKVLMPYHYHYRMGGELRNGQKGFVWQSIPFESTPYISWDLDDFPFYCEQRLGLYIWDNPRELRKLITEFEHEFYKKCYANHV